MKHRLTVSHAELECVCFPRRELVIRLMMAGAPVRIRRTIGPLERAVADLREDDIEYGRITREDSETSWETTYEWDDADKEPRDE